jgi:PAS domain S-box-containing protein
VASLRVLRAASLTMFHNELVDLLQTLGLDTSRPPTEDAWKKLLGDISRSYSEAEQVRQLMKRSFAFSSREMRQLTASLAAQRDEFAQIFKAAPVGMARIELDGSISIANAAMAEVVGLQPTEMAGRQAISFIHPQEEVATRQMFTELTSGRKSLIRSERRLIHKSGSTVCTKFGAAAVNDERGLPQHLIMVVEDVTERNRLEIELRHSQKLESVGRLAAGIAHEINTPIQFVGDNVSFLHTAFSDLLELCAFYRRLCEKARSAALTEQDMEGLGAAEEAADLAYLQENVPRSIAATLEGARRVAHIVQAMKSFAHPDRGEKTPADLNAALRSTLTVATNELKYVAEVETDLQPLPLVPCFLSDLNQVFLNLLVNAAHAVGDVVAGTGKRGHIRIKTELDGDHVAISVADTGTGIPEPIRDRVFDPFFTTKGVGKGTGQGLALARSVVVDKHGGTLKFETEVGKGTTFLVRLPLGEAARAKPEAA